MNDQRPNEYDKIICDVTEEILTNLNPKCSYKRNREIIAERFGLYGPKKTLNEIGKTLKITAGRVRQSEESLMCSLKNTIKNNKTKKFSEFDKRLIKLLSEAGRISKVDDLAFNVFNHTISHTERAKFIFFAEVSPSLIVINENHQYYLSIGIGMYGDKSTFKNYIDTIVKTVQTNCCPINTNQLYELLDFEHPDYIRALAKISKKLVSYKDNWGLITCASINPRNIQDKIYIVLSEHGKPLHFDKIAEIINNSDFTHKKATTQSVHNELIKDNRFVLIGHGDYALRKWRYSTGSLIDIITEILKKAGQTLDQEEIVNQVQKNHKVERRTILMYLHNKALFKNISKTKYTIL
jgi:signal peptidase I